MNKKMMKYLVLLTFVASILMIGLPTSMAAETGKTYSFTATSKQLEKIEELWGKDISRGEFLKIAFPEAVDKMSSKAIEELNNTKMIWPDPKKNIKSTAESRSTTKDIEAISYVIGHESNIKVDESTNPNSIDFDSGSRVWLPTPYSRIPFMDVLTCLWKNDNLQSSVYDYGENVNSVSASGKWPVTSSGAFQVTGTHNGILPEGQTPPAYMEHTQTEVKTVSP